MSPDLFEQLSDPELFSYLYGLAKPILPGIMGIIMVRWSIKKILSMFDYPSSSSAKSSTHRTIMPCKDDVAVTITNDVAILAPIKNAVIYNYEVKDNEHVRKGEPVTTLKDDKGFFIEILSHIDGCVHLCKNVNEEVSQNDILFVISPDTAPEDDTVKVGCKETIRP